jgi:hypothetical protein
MKELVPIAANIHREHQAVPARGLHQPQPHREGRVVGELRKLQGILLPQQRL